MDKKNPITGCRADTLFGYWMMAPERLDSFLEMAWRIAIDADQLKTFSERSQQLREQEAEKPFQIDNRGVAHLSVAGPITKYATSFQSLFGGTSLVQLREKLHMIRQQAGKQVQAVFMTFDSPGGSSSYVPELAAEIRKLGQIIPVFGHAPDQSCSASLFLCSQCTRFTNGVGAAVGSLGTIAKLYDTSERDKTSGVKPVVIATSPIKMIGATGEITEEHKAEIKRYVDSINQVFVDHVKQGRGLTDEQLTEVRSARAYVGQDAVKWGLSDGVCTEEEAYDALQETLSTGKVIRGTGSVVDFKPATLAGAKPRQGARVMLSTKQLEQARTIPGAEQITQESADVTLLQIALQQQQDLKIYESQQTEGPVDVKLATKYATLAQKQVDTLGKDGKLVPEQVKHIKDLCMTDGKPNVAFVVPDSTGPSQFDRLIQTFELNKPNGVVTPVTGAQPAQRQEPGAEDQPKKPDPKRIAALRQQAGFSATVAN